MAAKIGAGVGALVLVGVGAFVAADPLGLRGSTAAGSKAAPADTALFAAVDLAPGASQQIEMIRFAAKFPSLREKFKINEGTDPKKSMFESMAKEENCSGVDYDSQIKPWVGDQLAVAVRAGASTDDPLLLIQAGDEKKARAGIQPLADCAKMSAAYANGNLILAKGATAAEDAAGAAKQSSLADRDSFKEAMGKLGSSGVVTFWMDGPGYNQWAEKEHAPTTSIQTMAGSVRFSGGNPELTAVSRGGLNLTGKQQTRVGELPAETQVAIGLADGRSLAPQIDQLLIGSGVDRSESVLDQPDDLETLLGDDLVIALETLDLGRGDPSTAPAGAVLKSDRAKLDALLARLEKKGLPPLTKAGSDPLYVSLNPAYAQKLSKPDKKLKDTPQFKAAVADPGSAQAVVYLDLTRATEALSQLAPENAADLKPLKALGISATGSGDWTRVVARVAAE